MNKIVKISLVTIVVGVAATALVRSLKQEKSDTTTTGSSVSGASSTSPGAINGTFGQFGAGSQTTSATPVSLATIMDQFQKLKELMAAERSGTLHGKELSEARRELKKLTLALREALATSAPGRDELLKLITAESDKKSKHDLANILHRLPVAARESLELQLANDSTQSVDNRKVGIDGLATLGTQSSLESLKTLATTDKNVALKGDAVNSIMRSLSGVYQPTAEYQAAGAATLKTLTAPTNDPVVRAAAFRSYAFRENLTPQDYTFINSAISKETNPTVKKALMFASSTMEARKSVKKPSAR